MGAIAPIDSEKCAFVTIDFPKIQVAEMDFDNISLKTGLKRELAPID